MDKVCRNNLSLLFCVFFRRQVEVRVKVRCKDASCTVRFLVAQGGDGPDDPAQCESVKEYIESVSGISLLESGISATWRLASESVVRQLPTRDMARTPTVHRQTDCLHGGRLSDVSILRLICYFATRIVYDAMLTRCGCHKWLQIANGKRR